LYINRTPVRATIIFLELVPPQLTGQERCEELRNLRRLASRVTTEFYEVNPEIDREAWNYCAYRYMSSLRRRRPRAYFAYQQ